MDCAISVVGELLSRSNFASKLGFPLSGQFMDSSDEDQIRQRVDERISDEDFSTSETDPELQDALLRKAAAERFNQEILGKKYNLSKVIYSAISWELEHLNEKKELSLKRGEGKIPSKRSVKIADGRTRRGDLESSGSQRRGLMESPDRTNRGALQIFPLVDFASPTSGGDVIVRGKALALDESTTSQGQVNDKSRLERLANWTSSTDIEATPDRRNEEKGSRGVRKPLTRNQSIEPSLPDKDRLAMKPTLANVGRLTSATQFVRRKPRQRPEAPEKQEILKKTMNPLQIALSSWTNDHELALAKARRGDLTGENKKNGSGAV